MSRAPTTPGATPGATPSAPLGATLGEEMNRLTARLARTGSSSPRLDARLLVGHALDVEMTEIVAHPERRLSAGDMACIEQLGRRRADREPMAQILGTKEFWSLPFKVTGATLVPRPESESLIEAALDWLDARRDRRMDILDMGTGSGALLLALLSELPNARGLGTDISPSALEVARENARRLGLGARARFQSADWGAGLTGRFHVILVNPPYVTASEMGRLPPEVRLFEPGGALAGGPDGLLHYRVLVPQSARLLHPGGGLFLEVGQGLAPKVAKIVTAAGFAIGAKRRDLAGVERCVWATRDDFRRKPSNKSFCMAGKSATQSFEGHDVNALKPEA